MGEYSGCLSWPKFANRPLSFVISEASSQLYRLNTFFSSSMTLWCLVVQSTNVNNGIAKGSFESIRLANTFSFLSLKSFGVCQLLFYFIQTLWWSCLALINHCHFYPHGRRVSRPVICILIVFRLLSVNRLRSFFFHFG